MCKYCKYFKQMVELLSKNKSFSISEIIIKNATAHKQTSCCVNKIYKIHYLKILKNYSIILKKLSFLEMQR